MAGTFNVTILKTHTHACLGAWTAANGCNNTTVGVTIVAGGNVLVSATDRSRLLLITASLAGGYVGVGVAVGVAKVDKDTQAYIGANSRVDAMGNTSEGLEGVYDGGFTDDGFSASACPGSSCYHGLAVLAASAEDIFGLAAAAGGGVVGVAGGVGVTLIAVTTAAFIAQNTRINQRPTASTTQSVNVSAVDDFKSLTVAGGVAGGFVGSRVASTSASRTRACPRSFSAAGRS